MISVAPAASPKIVPSWARNLNMLTGISSSLISYPYFGRKILNSIMNEIYSNKSIIHPTSVEKYLMPYLNKEAHRAFSHHLTLLGRSDAFEALAKIQSEVLLIQGGDDRIIPAKVVESIHREIPKSQLKVIPRAGHHPMEESPKEFNDLALNFLL